LDETTTLCHVLESCESSDAAAITDNNNFASKTDL